MENIKHINHMKNYTVKFALTSMIGLLSVMNSSAYAQDIQNSVVTVDELLRIDNAQALEKARAEAVKSGLTKEKDKDKKVTGGKVETPLPHWTVRAIFGAGANVAADLVVDGSPAYSIIPGSIVAMCKVKAIANACVNLIPTNSKLRKGSCPEKICWTGNELSAELRPEQTKVSDGSKILPVPLPMPPIPIPSSSASPSLQAPKK